MRVRSCAPIAIAISIVVAGDRGARADCPALVADVITSSGAHVPSDGGVLVGWKVAAAGKPGDGDPSQLRWRASAGSIVRETLAPGLTLYRVKPSKPGALSLSGDKAAAITVTIDARKGMVLPAPDVTSLAISDGADASVVAQVARVPAGAAALIAYATTDDEHVPLAFGRVAGGSASAAATSITVFHATGGCAPAGMRAPAHGDEVSFAWVDAFGRLSAVGAGITAR